MEWQQGEYTLSNDPDLIDLDYTFGKLSETYWASTRSRGQVETAIRNSINFVLLYNGVQVGFGRVITDRAVVAYLADVFIDEAYRGKGLAKWLVACVISHPDLVHCKILLETADAHGLYEKFEFEHIPAMKRNPKVRFGE